MKRIIMYIIGAAGFVVSVILMTGLALQVDSASKGDKESIHAPMSHSVAGGYSTIVIDSCEYISWGHGLAHKGNCRFCAERRKKETIKDIIKFNKNNNYGKDSI